ncbi:MULTISPECIES: EthD family reductase [unclassified Parafrankia]|uniref:EthD family reductase n=1 Tax=unclassified Parafrankia TaxID=2994368 RepID=UPI000DA54D9B|nr:MULTISPECIES: EthD family reductase [unclassified Parafrankia]TCJ33494.1 EthD family reductase [Parafrankia sp. BMG5.11]SQD97738.1 conserved hypothetical protein [Parafrankia sp. Ea1.12]
MPKIIALIKRKQSLTREEFLYFWQAEHPPLVWALPGLRRYVQNPSLPASRTWAYDGAAELWFDSKRDVATAFASEAAEPLVAHERLFIDDIVWFLVDEVEVKHPAAASASPTEIGG